MGQSHSDCDPGVVDCLTSAQLHGGELGTVGSRAAGAAMWPACQPLDASLPCCFWPRPVPCLFLSDSFFLTNP